MTPIEPDDDSLLRQFAEWREADMARTPAFARVEAGRPRVRVRTWQRPALAFASVALVVVAVVRWRAPSAEVASTQIAFTAGSLRVPTDFLLDQVASVRAGQVPTIGSVDWYPLLVDDAPTTTAPRRRN